MLGSQLYTEDPPLIRNNRFSIYWIKTPLRISTLLWKPSQSTFIGHIHLILSRVIFPWERTMIWTKTYFWIQFNLEFNSRCADFVFLNYCTSDGRFLIGHTVSTCSRRNMIDPLQKTLRSRTKVRCGSRFRRFCIQPMRSAHYGQTRQWLKALQTE